MLSHLCQISSSRSRLVHSSINDFSLSLFLFAFVYKLLTGRCLVYLTHLLVLSFYLCILLFQPMTLPRDTCFSDLPLTARSVDNSGLRLCTVSRWIRIHIYKKREKIIERQERPYRSRYPSLNYWFLLFSLSLSLCFIRSRTLCFSLFVWCRCNHH